MNYRMNSTSHKFLFWIEEHQNKILLLRVSLSHDLEKICNILGLIYSWLSVCTVRLKESCPLWKSAGCQWSPLGVLLSTSPWAERIRPGSWTPTCPSSSWSPPDWYTLLCSLVRHPHWHIQRGLVRACTHSEHQQMTVLEHRQETQFLFYTVEKDWTHMKNVQEILQHTARVSANTYWFKLLLTA